MFLSLAHSHFVERTVDNGIEVHITKNTNECIICASHFKISVSPDTEPSPVVHQWEIVEFSTRPALAPPLTGNHNNRAPPFVVYG
jgi:hypothetical protein